MIKAMDHLGGWKMMTDRIVEDIMQAKTKLNL